MTRNTMTRDNIGAETLRAFVERIERLEAEKAALVSDLKDLYQEVQSAGYTPKVLRALIRERKADPKKQADFFAELDVYRSAVGAKA